MPEWNRGAQDPATKYIWYSDSTFGGRRSCFRAATDTSTTGPYVSKGLKAKNQRKMSTSRSRCGVGCSEKMYSTSNPDGCLGFDLDMD
ncbi:hypothetical protein ACOMHN_031886 [Nucella lapillus]